MRRNFYSLLPSPLIRDETSDRVGFFWCSSRTCSRMRMGSSRATMGAARSSLRFGGATSSRIWSLVRGSIMNGNNLPLVQGCSRARRTDGNLLLVPLTSRGIEKNNTASVHAGFLISYNSVRAAVIHTVRDQLLAFPEYTVVVTGTYVTDIAVLVSFACWAWLPFGHVTCMSRLTLGIALRTFNGRRVGVHRCTLCQVELAACGRPFVHLWCVAFRLRDLVTKVAHFFVT